MLDQKALVPQQCKLDESPVVGSATIRQLSPIPKEPQLGATAVGQLQSLGPRKPWPEGSSGLEPSLSPVVAGLKPAGRRGSVLVGWWQGTSPDLANSLIWVGSGPEGAGTGQSRLYIIEVDTKISWIASQLQLSQSSERYDELCTVS